MPIKSRATLRAEYMKHLDLHRKVEQHGLPGILGGHKTIGDIALDETGAPYEEELSSEIYKSRIFWQSGVKPLKQKKKSKVLVSQFKGW